MNILRRLNLLEKINVNDIIGNHVGTLVNDNSKKHGTSDWFTFAAIPILFSTAMFFLKLPISNNSINIIITSLSIFVGLLFNMVVLIFDILNKPTQDEVKKEVLKQILSNISFTILLSIVMIGFCLVHLVPNALVKTITGCVIYLFLALFFLTLLMILKRMSALFDSEVKKTQE